MIRWRSEKPDVHTLTGAYTLNAVDESERTAVERHLLGCASCAEEISEFTDTVGTLSGPVEAAPPSHLRGQVLAAIRQTPQLSPPPRPRQPITMPWATRWWGGLPVATVGVVLLVFFAISVLGQRDSSDSTFTNQAVTAEILRANDAVTHSASAANGAVLTVITSPRHNASIAVMTNMAKPVEGHAYQLWLIGPNGVRSAGVVPSGATTRLISHVDATARLGLTLEPEAGSAQPTSQPLLIAPLR